MYAESLFWLYMKGATQAADRDMLSILSLGVKACTTLGAGAECGGLAGELRQHIKNEHSRLQ